MERNEAVEHSEYVKTNKSRE